MATAQLSRYYAKIEFQQHVRAILKAVDKTAREGGIDPDTCPGFVLESLEFCKKYHWDAYARIVMAPSPTPEVIEEVKAIFKRRAGLWGL